MLILNSNFISIFLYIIFIWNSVFAIQPSSQSSFNFDSRKAGTGNRKSTYPSWGAASDANNSSFTPNVQFINFTKDLKSSSNSQLDVTALLGVFDKQNLKSKFFNQHISQHEAPHLENSNNVENLDFHNAEGLSELLNTGGHNLGPSSDYDYDYHAINNGGGDQYNNGPHFPQDVDYVVPLDSYVTVTETRHLTSYVTTSVVNTAIKYLTQVSTQFVPTHVPTYITNYVTSVATAYVTQKFPVYKTKFVTEYHTQLHTQTDTKTDFLYKTHTEYNTNYITTTEKLKFTSTEYKYVTDYITKTVYITDTIYLTSTEAFHSTSTTYRPVPYPITTTIYDTIYFTKTVPKPFQIISTVYQPQYLTEYVTVTEPKHHYAPNLDHYPGGNVPNLKPQYRIEASSKILSTTTLSKIKNQ
ncbi:UNVERIFIED_CONTAM: hypothetical protein RMT77_002480 [Armadillidium vulgare]